MGPPSFITPARKHSSPLKRKTELSPRAILEPPSLPLHDNIPPASSANPPARASVTARAAPLKRNRTPAPAPKNSASKQTSPSFDTKSLYNDRLGRLVSSLCSDLQGASSWEAFVNDFRGRSYLAPDLEKLDHPAADLLKEWRDKGVPVNTTSTTWSQDQLNQCVQRGCHYSATEHAPFLREEMSEFIENKFWVVLPFELARELPALHLSPAAVKVERDRKPRLISDHTFEWGDWPSVNQSTIPHAPPEAMQFGHALPRILHQIRHADPKFGPPRLCKHDIKDGFYRMFLRASDCPRLALVLPTYPGEPQLIAIPMSSTMGWVQSPPTFSTMSETACDVANQRMIESPTMAPPH